MRTIIEVQGRVALYFCGNAGGGAHLREKISTRDAIISALPAGLLTAVVVIGGVMALSALRAQPPQPPSPAVSVHFTDVRKAAGITFQHDATMC